ncbi:hypothetical protein Pcinc_006516 [Petrolisthes cinctipes]|uniref:Uncharacterized protein n=1 Tax=Petrolisthes cinctipes TaxID=88211 RepID=A0AAE1GCS9_PETCI|nr:hypothetical protein Pcinc_006516 [Petrolisthes cinctipes]
MTLIRTDLSQTRIEQPVECGKGTEHLRGQSPSRTNHAGRHLHHIMQDTQTMQLLNNVTEPTHICGGRLDLAFASHTLASNFAWRNHNHLASDHYATVSTIATSYSNHVPPQLTGWNIKEADSALFEHEITQWWEEARNRADRNLDEHE